MQTIVECSTIWIQYVRRKTDSVSLCGDPMIQKDWKKKYKDNLVGITTTSLFGSYSMYNRIPVWKKLGKTMGSITIKQLMIFSSIGTNGSNKIIQKNLNDGITIKSKTKCNQIDF